MDMIIGIIDSYGYGAMVGGIVAYHLFPDFVGGKNEEMHHQGLKTGEKVIDAIMKIKGGSPYLAGSSISIADFLLAPIMDYIAMTPHKDTFLARPGVHEWWDRMSASESFKATQP